MIFAWRKSKGEAVALLKTVEIPQQPGRRPVYDLISDAVAKLAKDDDPIVVEIPDENVEPDGLRFAAGAKDNLFGWPDRSADQTRARTVAQAIGRIIRSPSSEAIAHLLTLTHGEQAAGIVDEVVPRTVRDAGDRHEVLATLARRLIRSASDVEAVKIAIAILGGVGSQEDVPLLLLMGRFEELTLFCNVACSALATDSERALWTLARTTRGWGRVNAVERLAATSVPEIKSWMLRHGYSNAILYEYLACICARAGELHREIAADEVDDELLTAAGEILRALARGRGPAEGLEDYEHGAFSCVACLRHMAKRPRLNLSQLESAQQLRQIADGPMQEELRQVPGWDAQAFLDVRTLTNTIFHNRENMGTVEEGLASEDVHIFNVAADVARAFDIDAWPLRLAKQRSRPSVDQWFWLMQTDNVDRIESVLALAREQLDLAKAGSGPLNQGFGTEFGEDMDFDFILQELSRFPGVGWDFVKTGLRGRTYRARNMAARALSQWGKSAWPAETEAALLSAMGNEPDEELRTRMRQVLDGERLE